MFLHIFIAAAGAVFQLNIVENYERSYHLCFLFIFIAAAGAFVRLNINENDGKSYYLCFYSSL